MIRRPGGPPTSLPPSSTGSITTMSAAAASASSSSSAVMAAVTNPVSNGRKRSRQRRRGPYQKGMVLKRAIQSLLAIVLTFCVVDLYYLIVVTKHHHLKDIKPAFQEQKEIVKQVWKKEKEELKDEWNSLVWHDKKPKQAMADPYASHPEEGKAHMEHDVVAKTQDGDEEHDDLEYDKGPIYEILLQAGVAKEHIDVETRRKLPTWTKVQELYGKEPKIYGLDRCKDFTDNIEPSVSFFGIAGTFNSGTNLLAEMLIQNCQITKRMEKFGTDQKGMRWQVPWGKHTPVQFRAEHVTTTDKDVPLQNSFPMITIRDPYRWMRSMCKHIYGARWDHNATVCPHIYSEENKKPSKTKVKYAQTIVYHDSLPGFWNDWYNSYLDVSFPRVLVRFEDLLFYGKNVTETLCKCGGGDPRRSKFVHVKSSAKLGTAAHGANKTGLLDALIQFGSSRGRTTGMSETDIVWAKKLLDPKLMKMFAYDYATSLEE